MSRTIKGSKAPGWEPWSNRHERQIPLLDEWTPAQELSVLLDEEATQNWFCYMNGGCPRCTKEDTDDLTD